MSVTERDRETAAKALRYQLGAEDIDRVAAALAAERERVLAPVLAPGDPNARMDAYYYGFEQTGVGIVDAILSAVATAGKHYHGTDMWADEDYGPSEEARIQAAANEAADRIRRAAQDGES